jgi:hypothetical protein
MVVAKARPARHRTEEQQRQKQDFPCTELRRDQQVIAGVHMDWHRQVEVAQQLRMGVDHLGSHWKVEVVEGTRGLQQKETADTMRRLAAALERMAKTRLVVLDKAADRRQTVVGSLDRVVDILEEWRQWADDHILVQQQQQHQQAVVDHIPAQEQVAYRLVLVCHRRLD